ncbi:endonuclease/exonuclease/phosphatase family protein [Pseudotamlana carrageenivorans]|uniref:endonuclease/exonuclease/phosphatase family protein n=1 Tax=Pseudotamlana carrageenivorans TaxID=2069432 RepID=UPI0013155C7B|nr:endonuclease/exonuclease/phosphatase family protein [Tamlana carrageenivorans]
MNLFKSTYVVLRSIIAIVIPLLLVFGCVITRYVENVWSLIFSVVLPVLVVLNGFLFVVFILLKSKRAFFLGFALVLYSCTHVFFFKYNFDNQSIETENLSVLTYNVRGGGGAGHTSDRTQMKPRIKALTNFINNQDADVVLFQESWSVRKNSFENYPYVFVGKRRGISKSLQVILSKFPIVHTGYIDFPNTANNAMFADIQYNDVLIRIYNVHLQSFSMEVDSKFFTKKSLESVYPKINVAQKMKSAQTQLLLENIKGFQGRHIVAGDFNTTPFSKTYHSISQGRQDTFLEKGSGLGGTYHLLGYPMRLDYVLPDNSFQIVAHENFNLKWSDHEPILVQLTVNKSSN